jgi:hypothetical protein
VARRKLVNEAGQPQLGKADYSRQELFYLDNSQLGGRLRCESRLQCNKEKLPSNSMLLFTSPFRFSLCI